MVTIHHLWGCVSGSIWSHLADGSNCPGWYWPVTESNLMAGSLMMMSSVPLHWDPVQFQKQIQPFIFQIIVALYQLLPVFYLSLRLMWSFSQTALWANGFLEHTCRAVCACRCECVCASIRLKASLHESSRTCLWRRMYLFATASIFRHPHVCIFECNKIPPLIITTIYHLHHYYFYFISESVLLCVFMTPFNYDSAFDEHLQACAFYYYNQPCECSWMNTSIIPSCSVCRPLHAVCVCMFVGTGWN